MVGAKLCLPSLPLIVTGGFMTMFISFVVTMLVIYTFTYKYLKQEQYLKYVGLTFLYSMPIAFVIRVLVFYITGA